MVKTKEELHDMYVDAVENIMKGSFEDGIFTLQYLAEHDYASAIHFLAWCYQQGVGLEVDVCKAFELWKKSAPEGIRESQDAIANYYEHGECTEKDLVKSFYWAYQASKAGMKQSTERLERLKQLMSDKEMIKAKMELASNGFHEVWDQ